MQSKSKVGELKTTFVPWFLPIPFSLSVVMKHLLCFQCLKWKGCCHLQVLCALLVCLVSFLDATYTSVLKTARELCWCQLCDPLGLRPCVCAWTGALLQIPEASLPAFHSSQILAGVVAALTMILSLNLGWSGCCFDNEIIFCLSASDALLVLQFISLSAVNACTVFRVLFHFLGLLFPASQSGSVHFFTESNSLNSSEKDRSQCIKFKNEKYKGTLIILFYDSFMNRLEIFSLLMSLNSNCSRCDGVSRCPSENSGCIQPTDDKMVLSL